MSTVRRNRASRLSFCFGVTLLLLGASGCADREPPVATVSLGLDRATVPLGGPLDLAIRFDVSPALEGLGEDALVFVHFLDANDELMWADDHDPPTPTTEWRPGQTISYSRRTIVPMYPYIGEATIAVGLYSATTGERLALAGEDLGQRTYRVATLTLEPQSSFLVYGDGWHQAEFDRVGRQWRWTAEQAELSFRNPMSDAVLHLEVEGRPDLFGSPQTIAIAVEERTLHERSLGAAGLRYEEFELAAADLGDAPTVELAIQVDRTFVPAEVDETGKDTRRLGVRVSYVFLEPR